ncbi:hypothetical protein FN846DRAFT_896552 [Sphaerosporella brunnea]|uniref:BTB domain-containing protein n=1 Tax=Sphaerosporella brunnea TaxID=1250544 RepID=A0A5J5EBC9_9PEZI|nr:hypothetical protein FN846DRAFT_896552 [Sphaerosporella brunnea]
MSTTTQAKIATAKAATTLPPRPPPSQVPARTSTQSSAPIIPALPMGVINPKQSKKTYTPTGIGRGHASLPPKPGFPGKSLPRETDAIVLTPCVETLSYTNPLKGKRTYSAVASENIMRPMDPAVTNLTPQNTVSPSAVAPIPRTLTPPAESTVQQLQQQQQQSTKSIKVLVEARPDAINIAAPTIPSKAPVNNNRPNGSIDSQIVNNNTTPASNTAINNSSGMDPTAMMFRPEQQQQFQHHDHRHMANYPNGLPPPPDMYGHPMGHQFMTPHPPHQPGFYNQHHYQGGTLTPPNTGNVYMMPMQPAMENMMFSDMANNSPGGGQGEMFVPGPYGGFQPPTPDHSGQHPPMRHPHFQSMGGPDMHHHPDSRHQMSPPAQPSSGFHTPAVEHQQAPNKPAPSVRLGGLSFVAPDEDPKNIKDSVKAPDTAPKTPPPPPPQPRSSVQLAAHDGANTCFQRKDVNSQHHLSILPLDSYLAQQFMSKKLADVTLVLVRRGAHNESFPAHSFILGRSPKLCELLEHAEKMDSYSTAPARPNSWADDVEGEESLARMPAIRSVYSVRDGMITISMDTSVDREPFLLVLKTLYGASGWDLDAFLDPQHPGHQGTNGVKEADDAAFVIHKSLSSLSLVSHDSNNNGRNQDVSVQVQMLERSIQIFCAGALLGLDNVIFQAIDSIKRWGLVFEGGAFERLLKFLLEDVNVMKNDPALRTPHWAFADSLLDEAIGIFARDVPEGFKLDFRAPNSQFLNRLGSNLSPPPSTISTPPAQGANQQLRMFRQIQSTILLSVPFDVMKRILEHDTWMVANGRRRIFELSSAVVQERERRRKREIKAIMDLGGKAGSDSGSDPGDRILDSYPEVLCWEESAVSTFGHGGIGIEIAKRRKGGPGGRMLWKVGRSSS